MDLRYLQIINFVMQHFVDHLGSRLQSIYVKGSIARGDAVWGISDLDLVLAFDCPTQEDTLLKRDVEAKALDMPGGEALVIQRIADDRLQQMDEKTKAFWLYSSIYDSQLVYGKHPQQFLPDPPPNSPELILSLLYAEGKHIADIIHLDEAGCRSVTKRILQCLSMIIVHDGHAEYVPLLNVPNYPFPSVIMEFVPTVIELYSNPRVITDTNALSRYWHLTCHYISTKVPIK
jgi:hypothetical protein